MIEQRRVHFPRAQVLLNTTHGASSRLSFFFSFLFVVVVVVVEISTTGLTHSTWSHNFPSPVFFLHIIIARYSECMFYVKRVLCLVSVESP